MSLRGREIASCAPARPAAAPGQLVLGASAVCRASGVGQVSRPRRLTAHRLAITDGSPNPLGVFDYRGIVDSHAVVDTVDRSCIRTNPYQWGAEVSTSTSGVQKHSVQRSAHDHHRRLLTR